MPTSAVVKPCVERTNWIAVCASVASDPNNVEFQRDLGDSYRKMGDFWLEAGGLNSALAQTRESLTIYENLQKLDSTSAENQSNLVQMYDQNGEVLDKMKRWSESQDTRFKALAVLDNLSKAESKARMSKEQVRRLIAIEDTDIAREYEGVATDARTPVAKRRES